ncbi:hypothetical protein [Halalkalibaculum sp. DA384]|uniref:hypothetical protein n=1 Tax=Halalkalibaculum sp. DA384 TaxID=3373606 RepID=UPI003754FD3A
MTPKPRSTPNPTPKSFVPHGFSPVMLIAIATLTFLFLSPFQKFAQGQQAPGQQFRMGERIIRVAEPGQLADSVNVWGDVGSPGRYLVPKDTRLPQLISYAFGPGTLSNQQTQLDWSKMRIEVNISEYSSDSGMETLTQFKYRMNEPLPEGMRKFKLENNQVVALQVKRRPSIIDYAQVIGPIISLVATSIILVERL